MRSARRIDGSSSITRTRVMLLPSLPRPISSPLHRARIGGYGGILRSSPRVALCLHVARRGEECQSHRKPAVWRTVSLDRSAHGLGEALGHGQPEPYAG